MGRGSRWLLHATVLVAVGLASFLPPANDARTVSADNPEIADESVWQPQSGVEGYSLTPSEEVDGLVGNQPQETAAPTPSPTATSTPPPTATRPADTPTPAPTPTRSTEPQSYRVQAGDTVSAIAGKFGVSSETILWANGIANPNSLSVGQTLMVLPVSGVIHQVKEGDTLSSIAALYGVQVSAITTYNNIGAGDTLQPGRTLMVPGAKATPQPTSTPTPKPTATPLPTATRVPPTATPVPPPPTATPRPAAPTAPAPAARAAPAPAPTPAPLPKGNGQLAWPVSGTITQQFGEQGHTGVDIATAKGTPIRAAADGKVINLQQLNYGYGWYLVIDHGNGIKTLYSHLSGFNVKLGDTVKRGQQIGAVGATGKATGPHLHFEVRINDKLMNPLSYL